MSRKKIAVFFGGRSPEHDVSVVSGLQALDAIDTRIYDPFPVYITPQGEWLLGDELRNRNSYMFSEVEREKLNKVTLDVSHTGQGRLISTRKKMFGKFPDVYFDVAFPAFHGLVGEDGQFQGLMETANVPYAGMRTKASAVFMDKITTKYALAGTDVPLLPIAYAAKPLKGLLIDEGTLKKQLGDIGFPCCVKPAHLGSSIGVGKANNIEEARAILANLFAYDDMAIIEPYVENLTEYNVSVRRNSNGEIETSSIEKPISSDDILDFKQKYKSGDGKSGSKKMSGPISQGMLSLTRDINPAIADDLDAKIRGWAHTVFERLNGTGVPRIDFISNGKTGDIWFNELNPCPGSFGYFLWDSKKEPVIFTQLISDLIEEAITVHKRMQLPNDPTPKDAQLFRRR